MKTHNLTDCPGFEDWNSAMVRNRKKNKTQLLRGSRGFTLVQVLVTIALVGVIALLLSNMLLNTNRQAKSVESKSEFLSFVNTIQSALNNSEACVDSLAGIQLRSDVGPAAANHQRISLRIGGTTYAAQGAGFAGATTTYGSLTISKLEFADRRAGAAANQFIVPVLLEVDRSQNNVNAIGGSLINHTFELVECERPVIDRCRKPETIFHQIHFS